MVARHLEANGIPTVILGAARDIVERCGVPRFVFSDFPLGNSCGRPFDAESQRGILALAFDLLETATEPRITVQSPYRWSEDEAWKKDYWDLSVLDPEEIAQRREAFDRDKAILATRYASAAGEETNRAS